MAKQANQKLKPLYLLKILTEQTDENHPLTMAQLIEQLAQYDISAERKSLYDDMETLRGYGTDIETTRDRALFRCPHRSRAELRCRHTDFCARQ